MKSLTNIIKKGVRNVAIVGATLAGLTLGAGSVNAQTQVKVFSLKHVTAENPQGIVTGGYNSQTANYEDEMSRLKTGQEQTENYKHFVNPYIAPRETKDCWGSGDADNNGIINNTDAEAMANGTANYRTDIDGDGVMSTSADLVLLNKYLNGEIKYLPGHLNKLESVAERRNWFKKMLAIDDTDYFREGWSCGNYSSNLFYNMNWVENITNWADYNSQNRIYDFSDLGIFNLPVYRVNTTAKNGESHAINGIFLGSNIASEDNSTNFNKWLFLEPQTDEEVTPGDFSMDENKPVKVGGYTYRYSNMLQKYDWDYARLIEWNLNDGTPSLSFQNQDLVTKRPSSSGIENKLFDKADIIGNVYPNPYTAGSGELTIPYYGNGLEANVLITDILGRTVYNEKYESTATTNEEIKISPEYTSSLSAGNYNITVSNDKGKEVSRIIVVK